MVSAGTIVIVDKYDSTDDRRGHGPHCDSPGCEFGNSRKIKKVLCLMEDEFVYFSIVDQEEDWSGTGSFMDVKYDLKVPFKDQEDIQVHDVFTYNFSKYLESNDEHDETFIRVKTLLYNKEGENWAKKYKNEDLYKKNKWKKKNKGYVKKSD